MLTEHLRTPADEGDQSRTGWARFSSVSEKFDCLDVVLVADMTRIVFPGLHLVALGACER